MSSAVSCELEPMVGDSLTDAFASLRATDLAALDVAALQRAATDLRGDPRLDTPQGSGHRRARRLHAPAGVASSR